LLLVELGLGETEGVNDVVDGLFSLGEFFAGFFGGAGDSDPMASATAYYTVVCRTPNNRVARPGNVEKRGEIAKKKMKTHALAPISTSPSLMVII